MLSEATSMAISSWRQWDSLPEDDEPWTPLPKREVVHPGSMASTDLAVLTRYPDFGGFEPASRHTRPLPTASGERCSRVEDIVGCVLRKGNPAGCGSQRL